MSKKIALLIGVSEYGEGIPPLSSALNDVEAMQRVLQNPNLGGFEQVERLLNPDAIAMRKAIQKLFKEALKDDLVLFFFSGHGITNDQDHLYLATRNTAKDDFEATAVDANFIQGQSNNCYARRQVLILDACYSGAIAQGWRTKSVGVDIKKQLGAEGRVVLTSSSATQTSFEQEGATLSLYTQYLVEGIETGAADKNGDGNIHVHELHDYAKAKVKIVKPNMTPDIILDKEGYNILLAYAPKNPEAEYRKLVEQYAQNGELDEFAFLVLKPKRKTFGLTDGKAEEIETEVLEPFRRRFANLESYKQAFTKAVERKYPLDEHTLRILKDYQQDVLGLRDEDVAAIKLEITSATGAEYQKLVQIQKPREKEEYKNKLRRYEQEFTKTVQAQYPLDEYVRIGLKQFQQSLELRDEDVTQIEEPILAPTEEAKRLRQREEAEMLQRQPEETERQGKEQQATQTTTAKATQENDDLSSYAIGVDYTRLRDLLKAGKWKEADQETLAIMLKVANREKETWLDTDSMEKFPCNDLRTIDQLWVKYSSGRYGLSVQKKIWLEVGKKHNAFNTRVGWQMSRKWFLGGFLNESSINYDGTATEGHLPACLMVGG
ncbi:caspase, EACC1-associated type, partial [Nostoc sp. WHI]|uniref:caspase, EACC1-associated type n=1 Tax=Nostoc sp. WHI TaxID=2650611 RepID=UPI0018C56ADA